MHYLHARACLHRCCGQQGLLLLVLSNQLQVVLIKRQIMVHPPYLVCSWPCNSSNVRLCNMNPWHASSDVFMAIIMQSCTLDMLLELLAFTRDHVCASCGLLEAYPDLLLWAEGADLGLAWLIGLATGKWQDNDRERESTAESELWMQCMQVHIYIYRQVNRGVTPAWTCAKLDAKHAHAARMLTNYIGTCVFSMSKDTSGSSARKFNLKHSSCNSIKWVQFF